MSLAEDGAPISTTRIQLMCADGDGAREIIEAAHDKMVASRPRLVPDRNLKNFNLLNRDGDALPDEFTLRSYHLQTGVRYQDMLFLLNHQGELCKCNRCRIPPLSLLYDANGRRVVSVLPVYVVSLSSAPS